MKKERPIIAIVINAAHRSFFSRSLYYLQKELFAANVDILIFSTLMSINNDPYMAAENDVFRLIPYDLLDGMVIYGNTVEDAACKAQLIQDIQKNFSGPVICVEEKMGDFLHEPFNDGIGAQLIVKHLATAHQAKRFVYISGPKDSIYHQKLAADFRQASKLSGLELNESDIYYGNDWDSDYLPIADAILAKGLPDAILCCSDVSACGMIYALSARNIRVPQDVLVTGYRQDEPYSGDYINLTSVIRNPEAMSVNIARKLLALIGVADLPHPDTTSSCRFVPGISCGCCEIDIAKFSKSALKTLTHTKYSGFDSDYNFMSEDLVDADDFSKYLWNLDYYTTYLGDFDGFWLCLNDNIMHSSGLGVGFTDTISVPYCHTHKKGSVDFSRTFPKNELLPDIFKHRIEPAAYIVTPLHFMGKSYGYTVLSYGDSKAVYDQTYAGWVRNVAIALEKQRKHCLYMDVVADAQIRDTLTGLLNMRGYQRMLSNSYRQYSGSDKLLRIISIDIANLKGINETFGYEEGNKALCRLANILTRSVTEDDICVRLSGDEFYIAGILNADSPVDEVPNNIDRNLNLYNSERNDDYGLHIHTGIATAPFDSKEVINTLPYEAVYQRTLHKHNDNKHQTTSTSKADGNVDLNEQQNVTHVLNENLFRYDFQPIVSTKTGEIFAYEALMRTSGNLRISPLAILQHAKLLDRVGDVERYTLFNTMDYYQHHQEQFNDRLLFINIIPSNPISDADYELLYSRYSDIMKHIVVEFTEQTEANDHQLDIILNRTKRCGFRVAIDDYGTGYSNVDKLLTLMPDFIKIDRSLITNIDSDRRKRHFAKTIIDYAHDNKFQVLAEGVETREELQTVIKMGFDLIQGYYTAKPGPEPINRISTDIMDEIIECNRQFSAKRVLKTYFTGTESETTLKHLDFNNYTDLVISGPDYTLLGDVNYASEINIRTRDNSDCTLKLVDALLQGNGTLSPCIVVGKNSKLTLHIEGNVTINGSIRVPEHSELVIVGNGSLSITSSTERAYAIGDDLEHSYGNISVFLKNRLFIHIDSAKSVAIGGGLNASGSKICIDSKEVHIEQTGKDSLGIGTMNGHATITINNTKMDFSERSANSVAIGSYSHSIALEVNHSRIQIAGSGDSVIGLGSFTQKGSSINLTSSRLDVILQAKNIIAIGIDGKKCAVTLLDSVLDIVCEGANVTAIGSVGRIASVTMYRCSGQVTIRSGNGVIWGAEEKTLELHYCDLCLNNND